MKRNPAICKTTGKKRYRDGDDAALALRSLRMLAAAAALEGAQHAIRVVRRYKCDHCKGWHLTSRLSPRQARDEAA